MKMSIAEAATALGKSERQVRYLVQQRKLKATKEGRSWQIESEDLPLGEARRRHLGERLVAARAQVEAAFEPVAKVVDGEGGERYSVRRLAAFETGRELHRELIASLGDGHPAGAILFEALVQLTQGCHAFRAEEKAQHFGEARRLAAAATAHLFMDPNGNGETLAARIEQELIPKIGGLVASQEKGGRRRESRFERFGSARRSDR